MNEGRERGRTRAIGGVRKRRRELACTYNREAP